MTAEDHAERALALAFSYVGRRERTAAEVRGHLEAKDVDARLVEATVTAFQEQGLLDDARFARLFTEDKRSLEGWGNERIARGLRARGLDRELIDAALAAGGAHEDELGRALELLRRRCPVPPADARARERAFGILLRKGFDTDLALDALNSYIRGSKSAAVS